MRPHLFDSKSGGLDHLLVDNNKTLKRSGVDTNK